MVPKGLDRHQNRSTAVSIHGVNTWFHEWTCLGQWGNEEEMNGHTEKLISSGQGSQHVCWVELTRVIASSWTRRQGVWCTAGSRKHTEQSLWGVVFWQEISEGRKLQQTVSSHTVNIQTWALKKDCHFPMGLRLWGPCHGYAHVNNKTWCFPHIGLPLS